MAKSTWERRIAWECLGSCPRHRAHPGLVSKYKKGSAKKSAPAWVTDSTAHYHLSSFVFRYVGPRHARIVRKHGQPLLWQSLRVVTLAAFDSLDRVQVVGHHPVQVEVRAGWNQVR